MTESEPSVEEAVRRLLADGGTFSSGDLAELTGLTRQALHRHLSRATAEGWLVREGRGRGTRYRAAEPEGFDVTYATAGLDESRVWLELRAAVPELGEPGSERAESIAQYVVTEIVNNAIDHSGSATVRVRAGLAAGRLHAEVDDEGIGAFESVRRGYTLPDPLEALERLSLGKVTTQPERHTGEGLFFSSKMVDLFRLRANGLEWLVDNERGDQAIRDVEPAAGTRVRFELDLSTGRSPVEVFDAYTTDFDFDRSLCVVRLFERGVRFVSRSEAKRLAAGLEEFREVVLDFQGVEAVGQGFVDELFRVWAREHPEVALVPRNMARAVEFMVRRGMPH